MNYGQLKSNVASWLHREDLAVQIATFVTLAEANIRRDVRVRAQETSTTGTTTGSITLPSDFLEARRFVLTNDVLPYATPAEYYEYTEDSGRKRFTIIGEALLSAAGDYQLDYWAAFAALAADSDTNWLLTNAPDVYLWASLHQAGIYTRDAELAQQARGEYLAAVQRTMSADAKSRVANPMQARPVGVYVV